MRNRLIKFLETEGISASKFADTIQIQRSTWSHILKGRNAPSLDVIIKTLTAFPRLNPDWMLLGVGEMYRQESKKHATLFEQTAEKIIEKPIENPVENQAQILSENSNEIPESEPQNPQKPQFSEEKEPRIKPMFSQNQTSFSPKSTISQDNFVQKNEIFTQETLQKPQRESKKVIIFYSDNTFEEFIK